MSIFYCHKLKKNVKVSYECKTGDLLILSENGMEVLELLKRARLEWAQAGGMTFSGFKEKSKNGKQTFAFNEIYFAYTCRGDVNLPTEKESIERA